MQTNKKLQSLKQALDLDQKSKLIKLEKDQLDRIHMNNL